MSLFRSEKDYLSPKVVDIAPTLAHFEERIIVFIKKSDPPTESLQQTDLSFKANTHYYDLISHYGAKVSMRTSRVVFATCCAICTTSRAIRLKAITTCAWCHTVVLTRMILSLTWFGAFCSWSSGCACVALVIGTASAQCAYEDKHKEYLFHSIFSF